MYCPLCRTEYREGFTRCANCDTDLVPSLPDDLADDHAGVIAWSGNDPVQFGAALAALRAANIPARQISRYNHLTRLGPPRPEYQIAVRALDASRAYEVIRDAFPESVSE